MNILNDEKIQWEFYYMIKINKTKNNVINKII